MPEGRFQAKPSIEGKKSILKSITKKRSILNINISHKAMAIDGLMCYNMNNWGIMVMRDLRVIQVP